MNQKTYSLKGGFTLIEIMVALALGILISLGIMKIFSANFDAYNLIQADSDILENKRIAQSVIVKDIQGSASVGCSKDGQVYAHEDFLLATDPDFNLSAFSGLDLVDNISAGQKLSDNVNGRHKDNDSRIIATGTDVLGIIKAVAVPAQMVSFTDNKLTLSDRFFRKDDYLLIMNCAGETNAEVFHITDEAYGTQQIVTLNKNISQSSESLLGNNGQLMSVALYKLEAISYFIAEKGGEETSTGLYSLYRKNNNRPSVEYLSGVDDLQVERRGSVIYIHLVLRSDVTRSHDVFIGPEFGKLSENDNKYPTDGRLRRLVSFSAETRGEGIDD